MSRQWLLTPLASACGYCGDPIRKGAPVLEIAGPGWRKVRCENCAGEPKPSDIGTGKRLAFPKSVAKPLADLAADFKLKQAGER